MSDKDKQPLVSASASAPQVAESADAALKHIADGFCICPPTSSSRKNFPGETRHGPEPTGDVWFSRDCTPELITQSPRRPVRTPHALATWCHLLADDPAAFPPPSSTRCLPWVAVTSSHAGHSDCGAMRVVLNPRAWRRC